MKVLGLIVARGGSKRLPGKNVRLLGGHPLIAWAVRAALGAQNLTRTLVSTDCPQIARCATDYGGEAPFLRPVHLATDSAAVTPVLAHALEWCAARDEYYTHIFLLQATSPFRTAAHVDEAITRYAWGGADTLTTVCATREHGYYQLVEEQGLLRPLCGEVQFALPRHALPAAYSENGAGYIIRAEDVARNNIYGPRVMPYLMDAVSSTDIDTLEDFQWAEYLLHRGLVPRLPCRAQ